MATPPIHRIGILTGGGDCPGLNAVIRAVAKSAINDYGWEVWGIEDGFLGLVVGRMRPLAYADVSNILLAGGTILGTSNKADPRRFAVATDDHNNPIFRDVSDQVMENYRNFRLDAVVVVGGDGTMSVASSLLDQGFRCVGVPKTIDNDLMLCDMTFGFQTAVTTAAEAIDRIHTTASSHHRVMLVETMGRNAGWLTLYAGMASGADVILLPEIPYDTEKIASVCRRRSMRGKAATIIAVSEGARPAGGEQTVRAVVKDSTESVRLGGVSNVLAAQLGDVLHQETRATVLGHIQRGGTPTPMDRVLATQFGKAATNLLGQGRFGRLVVMQNNRITDVDISEVAGKQRLVPRDHPLIATARSLGISFGD